MINEVKVFLLQNVNRYIYIYILRLYVTYLYQLIIAYNSVPHFFDMIMYLQCIWIYITRVQNIITNICYDDVDQKVFY